MSGAEDVYRLCVEALDLLQEPQYIARALPGATAWSHGLLTLTVSGLFCSVTDRFSVSPVRKSRELLEVRLTGRKARIVMSFRATGGGVEVSTVYEGPYRWRLSRTVQSIAEEAASRAIRDARTRRPPSKGINHPVMYMDLLGRCVLAGTWRVEVEKGGLPSVILGIASRLGGSVLVEGEWDGGEMAAIIRDGEIRDAVVVRGGERLTGLEALDAVEGEVTLRACTVEGQDK